MFPYSEIAALFKTRVTGYVHTSYFARTLFSLVNCSVNNVLSKVEPYCN